MGVIFQTKLGTIPDKIGTIPDKAGTIPDTPGTVPDKNFCPWLYSRQIFTFSGIAPEILALFQTNISIVWNVTKIFDTITDKHLHCPEYGQKSWHHSRQ